MGEEKKEDASLLAEAMPPTTMIYYEYDGCFQLECESKIVGYKPEESQKNGTNEKSTQNFVNVYLDQSVFHAQGGGQPTDTGTITCQQDDKEIVIAVEKVTIDRTTGVAAHRGIASLKDGGGGDDNALLCLPVGSSVRLAVDSDNRRILSECHTAGHVVDSCMAKIGKLMKPTKGYHFLDGPYVEYEGNIPPEERPQVLNDLQTAFKELVEEDIPTNIEILPEDKANEVCNRIAKNFDMKDFGGGKEEASDIRVVTVAGTFFKYKWNSPYVLAFNAYLTFSVFILLSRISMPLWRNTC